MFIAEVKPLCSACLQSHSQVVSLGMRHSTVGVRTAQSLQTQVAGQLELNLNNSCEVLSRAVQVRRRRFLRMFYKQITSVGQEVTSACHHYKP